MKLIDMSYEQEDLILGILREKAEQYLKDSLYFEQRGEYSAFVYHRNRYNNVIDFINQLGGN